LPETLSELPVTGIACPICDGLQGRKGCLLWKSAGKCCPENGTTPLPGQRSKPVYWWCQQVS